MVKAGKFSWKQRGWKLAVAESISINFLVLISLRE
jgi:hypothetical protein